MKKVRVDFCAHTSVVVQVEEGDDYLEKAADLAERFVFYLTPEWEREDGGVNDVEDNASVDVFCDYG